jgi:2'-5' RNA ligase
MRTFIVIPLPEDVRLLLGRTQEQLRACKADVRWTAVHSIHLTLRFLGEIDPALLPALIQSLLAETAGQEPFSICLSGLGAFPDLRRPRVIWCGLQGDLVRLGSLQRAVEAACIMAGLPPEDRPFHPHLTLGRVKGKTNLQPLSDYIKIASFPEHEFSAGAFQVYQSVLRPQGAQYHILERIELKDRRVP